MSAAGDETVLITGATSGIGLELARRFAGRARLLLAGRRPDIDVLPLLPAGAGYVRADQNFPEEAAGAIAGAIERLGWTGLDRAFLNAGTGFAVDATLETAQSVRSTLDANLFAAVAIAHTLLPKLEAAKGKLILIGSTSHRGAPGFATYAASKAGLDGFARALAEEWRGRVGVQVIHPGPVATGMHGKAGFDPGRLRRVFLSPKASARLIERLSETTRSRTAASHVGLALDRLGILR